MFFQYLSAKWVYLNLPNCLDSCPLKAEIETASSALALEAWEAGLSRPVPPELREKFEALAAGRG